MKAPKSYISWLRSQLDFIDSPNTYNELFAALLSHRYTWILPMDSNRAQDGKEVRERFYNSISYLEYPKWVKDEPCSFLEFLAAITFRMNYICSGYNEDKTKEIFWLLLSNLGINELSDANWERMDGSRMVAEAVERVCKRKIDINGEGGLFPLQAPKQNQREVEVWYQMQAYIQDANGKWIKTWMQDPDFIYGQEGLL